MSTHTSPKSANDRAAAGDHLTAADLLDLDAVRLTSIAGVRLDPPVLVEHAMRSTNPCLPASMIVATVWLTGAMSELHVLAAAPITVVPAV